MGVICSSTDLGVLARLDDHLVGDALAHAVGDVVADRRGEEHGVLVHNHDARAQEVDVVVLGVVLCGSQNNG